ncbi:MAG: hypothetical protein K0Q49_1575 [Haloplasmataceae bacterium]|jgi:hypothetical protein|nr:hypothetical protein [Haloplasmataceae bacterium]
MKKIVYLSLDERPCNYEFPYMMFNNDEFQIKRIDLSLLGYKKKSANIEAVSQWLYDECMDAYGLVLSIDTLVYGGIVPSRLHHDSVDVLKDRLEILKKIKIKNPSLITYAFQLIMRCPGYNSSDEEPDYYEKYGVNIFKNGFINHLISVNKAKEEDIHFLETHPVPDEFLSDFKNRREVNREINAETLNYVESHVIDFLVIPQDDSAEYGFTAIDQDFVRKIVDEKKLNTKVYMYPGADEVGMTLMSRMYTKFKNKRPKIYIKYPSITSGQIIPNIEDRFLDTTVKYHIMVSGGIVVTSLEECDAVAFINAPADRMLSRLSPKEEGQGMTTLRNMVEAFEFIEYALKLRNKAIIIGDVTYGNGSSLEIYNYLVLKDMLFDIAAYGGWNTASNAIGGAIAQGMAYVINGKTKQHMDFLMLRYVEDIAYDGYVRQLIKNEILPNYPQFNYYNVLETRGLFTDILNEQLQLFINTKMPELIPFIEIKDIFMPWKRMYEIGMDIVYKEGVNK